MSNETSPTKTPMKAPISVLEARNNSFTDVFISPARSVRRSPSPSPFDLDEIFQEGKLKQVLAGIFSRIDATNTRIDDLDSK